MKIMIYTLVLSVGLGPICHIVDPTLAYAATSTATNTSTSSTTNTNTNTTTSSNTSTSTSTATNANCANSGAVYGGGAAFSHCNKNDNQQNSQTDTEDLNDSGAQQSKMLGMMAIAAGAAMVAAGMAMVPPNMGLIAAGMALILAGTQALAAASKMDKNANKAGYNAGNMSGISNNGTPSGSSIGESGSTPGIKIDPSLARTGKASAIFDDFEQKTGISRDELINGLESGKSVPEVLGGSKKMGASEAQLAGMMDKASSSGAAMGADEAMAKLGLTAEDLAAYGKNTGMSATGEESVYGIGAGGGSRNPNSANTNSLDALFGAGTGVGAGGNDPNALGGAGLGLSPDVKAALDRNGITNRSIFQMVNEQYKRKTPMMFGVPAKRPTLGGTQENPFSNLGSGGKIEL